LGENGQDERVVGVAGRFTAEGQELKGEGGKVLDLTVLGPVLFGGGWGGGVGTEGTDGGTETEGNNAIVGGWEGEGVGEGGWKV